MDGYQPQAAFVLRRMALPDLQGICGLHVASFAVQSSARFLQRVYYPSFLAPGSTGLGYVAVDLRQVMGFCVAALDDAALHRAMVRRYPLECLLAALWKLVRGRRIVRRGATLSLPRIHYLAVAPSARGRGLGTQLSVLAQEAIRQEGYPSCWTAISRHNGASIALHQSMGFELDAELTAPGAELQEYRCDFTRRPGRS